MANITIAPEVMDVLKRSTITDNALKLPEQLDRELYVSVNKVLTNAGGKWNRSAGAHVFPFDPRPKLGLVIDTGVSVDEKKLFQSFYTPPDLARRVVELAEIKQGQTVLEPSAGIGNLIREITVPVSLVAFEINPQDADRLKQFFPWAEVLCGDFLMYDTFRSFDRIIMNPPFAKRQDIKHVTHALKFLKPGDILVSVMYPNLERKGMDEILAQAEVFDVPEETFKESGTPIKTILVKIRKP